MIGYIKDVIFVVSSDHKVDGSATIREGIFGGV